MSGTTEIKGRIESVKNTKKITNAMYLISSTKMQKAKQDLDSNEPYFSMLRNEIRRILVNAETKDSRYMYSDAMDDKKKSKRALLVITADKGLAGAYNHNVIKTAEEEMKKHADIKLFIVGEYGRRHFMKKNIDIVDDFVYTAQNPSFHRAREISEELLRLFNEEQVRDIKMIYSIHKNYGDAEVNKVRLLPLLKSDFVGKKAYTKKYEFYPSVDKVLDGIMQSYISSYVFGGLVESYASEQNARMNAMNSANNNADELMGELTMEYNRVRQAAITQEITEVAAGARAQKNKKMKEETPLDRR